MGGTDCWEGLAEQFSFFWLVLDFAASLVLPVAKGVAVEGIFPVDCWIGWSLENCEMWSLPTLEEVHSASGTGYGEKREEKVWYLGLRILLIK